MKRYYLSKIKQVTEGGMTFYKHRIQDFADVTYVGGEIAVDPNTGIPLHPAILVLVSDVNHQKFSNDPELAAMPVISPGVKVGATDVPTKNRFKAAAKAIGHGNQEVEDVVANADGWGDVLDHFGKKNNPNFSYLNFDVDIL